MEGLGGNFALNLEADSAETDYISEAELKTVCF